MAALLKSKGVFKEKPGQFDQVEGDLAEINSIEYIDQNPIGQSSRSNPLTFFNNIECMKKEKISSEGMGAKVHVREGKNPSI